MKPVLVVQHVAAEGPGAIGVQAAAAGLDLDVRAVWEDCSERASLPPTLRDHAALVIMGGPMAAHSDVGFSTRIRELALAREALERDLPTLGVCLGAQLIALAAGGQCYRGPAAEIGWYPIRFALATAAEADTNVACPPTAVPPRAPMLAGSSRCAGGPPQPTH